MNGPLDPRSPIDPMDRYAAEILDLKRRLEVLESPSGSQRRTTSDRATTLAQRAQMTSKYDIIVGGDFALTRPNDGAFGASSIGNAPYAQFLAYPLPTGRILVTVEIGRLSIDFKGGSVQAYAGFNLKDANGVVVPGGSLTNTYGRVIADGGAALVNLQVGFRTPAVPITIDPVLNPGPYNITPQYGLLVGTNNTTSVTANFFKPTMSIQHLEPIGGFPPLA